MKGDYTFLAIEGGHLLIHFVLKRKVSIFLHPIFV
jgi:hypothetical protein